MPFPEERPAPAPEVKWQVRASGVIQGPLTFSELLSLVRAGSVRSSDDAAPLGEPFRPLESYPLLMRELASRKGAPLTGRAVGAQVAPLYRRVAFLGMFALAASAGVGYGLAPELIDEQLGDLFSGLTRLGVAAGVDVGEHPLQRHFPKWESEIGLPSLSGTEALAAGRAALKTESLQGHQKADRAFRQGLLVEPQNPSLLAAFAENRAWLRAMGHDAEDLPLEAVAAYARTRRDGPESVDVLRAAGTVLTLRGGREQEVARALAAAESLDSNDALVQMLLALSRLDAPARAKRHAEKALKAAPGSTRAQLVFGMATRRLGEHDEAVKHLEARVRVEPKDALAGRELAGALLEQGLTRRATRALEVAFAEAGDPETARLYAATLLLDPAGARRADSILAEASKRAEADPAGGPLLALRARLLLDLGHAQQAVVVAEDAARRFPRDGEVKASLARAYEGTGRLDEARRASRQAEPLVSGRQAVARVIQERADLELRAGDRAAAAEAYEHSLSLAPERAGPRVALAVLSLERDDESAASVALMGLLEVDPRQDRERERVLEPFAHLPFALYQERAAAITKNDVSLVPLVVRGVSAYHGGDLAMAERALTGALRKDRAHPVALLYAAVLDLEHDRAASAQRRLQLLDVTVPQARAPQLYLARLEADDRPQVAEARLGRLQADGRFLVEVTTTLGLVEAARGRPEKAAYHLRSAFLQDPSYLPLRRALSSAPVPLE